jgi:hypothetical protein
LYANRQGKVGSFVIWLKRLLPFLVIAAAWYGYDYYKNQRFDAEVSRADHIARVTARLWLANAELRPDSAAFLAYRDSLLTAQGLTADQIEAFMRQVRVEPQKYDTFAVLLTHYVDSLTHRNRAPAGAAGAADSTGNDGLE